MRRAALALALAACKSASHAPPPAAHDATPRAPAPAPDAAVAVAPADAAPDPAARPALPADERAALAGTIEAAAGREEAFRVVALDPTGATPPRTLTPDGASYFPVPGRRSLAILTTDHGDQHAEQLVLLGATPDAARAVGPSSSHVRSPAATPDGKAIVFEADSASFRDLYRLDLATDQVTRLTDDPQGNFEPSLSPDGARVAFTSSRDGDTEIYVAPTAGGAATRLTFFHKDDWQPAWSPDGAWIAFLSDREGSARLFLVHPDGTGARHAHEGELVGEEQDPTWSPDGRRLAYTVSTRDGASEVWWADVATGVPHRVSVAGARDEAPSWAPDGQHLVYVSTRDRRIDLWIGRADGTAESRLTDTPEEEWIPRWRP